jgi:endo-1,4-beta-xylanase
MAITLKVRILGADGNPVSRDRLERLYAADLHFEPFWRESSVDSEGTVTIATTGAPAALHAQVPVPFFGDVWVTADNEGEGYGQVSSVIDFVSEAAKSRLADVRRLSEGQPSFSAECRGHIAAAEEHLALAAKTADSQKKAYRNLLALSHALWAGELAVVERARRAIGRRRRRGFLFGCNAFGYKPNDPYPEYFSGLLNFATLPFYLANLEREEGKPDYRRIDEILEWCEQAGITPKGHPLWWGHEAGIPKWLEGADWETAQKHCRRVVSRSVSRYRGRIKVWDVINEAHDWANGLNLTHQQEVEITKICAHTARENDPKAILVVNNCCPFGEYAADGSVYKGPRHRPTFTPLSYMQAVMEAGVDFDAVGVQIYFPWRDLFAVNKLLDEYARFGKPVHITELGVSSGPWGQQSAQQSWFAWHGPWSERVQADWAEWFYTIAFSRPEIRAITWWDFSDPAFIQNGGMLWEDHTPKEMYHRLKALLSGWGYEGSRSQPRVRRRPQQADMRKAA